MQANQLTDELLSRDSTDEGLPAIASDPGIRVAYRPLSAGADLPSGLLAAVHFGGASGADSRSHDHRQPALSVQVQLEPLHAPTQTELWWATGAVERGSAGPIRYACDDHHLFAVIELDEREHGGISGAAAVAYAAMRRFQEQSRFPHLLRMWNYLDNINEGSGDLERYRQFCVGRARGLGDAIAESYPAATAIGRQHLTHQLQVFWLAGRTAGTPVENPRQVSAYRYPRAHGPVSPSFARATLAPDGTLLISGTASIVGHVSRHESDPLAQLEETLRNLAALNDCAAAGNTAEPLLKAYVRDRAHVDAIASRLRQAFPHSAPIFLAADVCRQELLVEIEGVARRNGG